MNQFHFPLLFLAIPLLKIQLIHCFRNSFTLIKFIKKKAKQKDENRKLNNQNTEVLNDNQITNVSQSKYYLFS
jgi:uncharacterized protein YdeI (YjbR/CyaY-like superfamily)